MATALTRLVSLVLRFPILGGCAVYVRMVTWSIFWKCLVRIPGTMHLLHFDLGGLTPLRLVEDVLVGWLGWVVVLLHEMGEHFYLALPGACHVGWVLNSLVWVNADVI